MEELDGVVDEIVSGVILAKSEDETLRAIHELANRIFGVSIVQEHLQPYATWVINKVKQTLESAGCSAETLERLEPLAFSLATFISENGIQTFAVKWVEILTLLADVEKCESALEFLEHLLDKQDSESTIVVPVEIEDGSIRLGPPQEVQTPSMGTVTSTENSNATDGPTRASTAKATYFTPEQKEQGRKIFARYDLDDSGTVNTSDEAMQMTTNIYFSLCVPVSSDEVKEQLKALQDIDEHPMDFEQYWSWLQETCPTPFQPNVTQN